MNVKLLFHSPLFVCSYAIRTCWDSHDKSDTDISNITKIEQYLYDEEHTYDLRIKCGEKDKALIERVGNKNKHKSTLEHLVYTFYIAGISRACLQELARHRIASYSVKSTRYVLSKELDKEAPFL